MILDSIRDSIRCEERADVESSNRAERHDAEPDDTPSLDAHLDEVSPGAHHEVGARRLYSFEDGSDRRGVVGHCLKRSGSVAFRKNRKANSGGLGGREVHRLLP